MDVYRLLCGRFFAYCIYLGKFLVEGSLADFLKQLQIKTDACYNTINKYEDSSLLWNLV